MYRPPPHIDPRDLRPGRGWFVAAGVIAGGVGALIVLPFAGTAIAAIIAVVTGVKRGNHRRRLLTERHGYPAHH